MIASSKEQGKELFKKLRLIVSTILWFSVKGNDFLFIEEMYFQKFHALFRL